MTSNRLAFFSRTCLIYHTTLKNRLRRIGMMIEDPQIFKIMFQINHYHLIFILIQFQVNISLAILFAVEGFFPKDVDGSTLSHYKDFSSALPLATFLLSLFASSFGTSKFLLNGPIQFISNDSAFNGMLSVPFLCLCILNAMFGCRIICIESSLFTTYRLHSYPSNIKGVKHGEIRN